MLRSAAAGGAACHAARSIRSASRRQSRAVPAAVSRARVAGERRELVLRLRPAALRGHDQAVERRLEVVLTARADGVQHREQSGRLGAAERVGVGEESRAVVRKLRRAIADQQALAEARGRFDVLLARSGHEMLHGVFVRARAIALLGELDVGRERLRIVVCWRHGALLDQFPGRQW